MTATGSGQWVRGLNGSNTGFRGLLLALLSTPTATNGSGDAVPFDTIVRDTDGIASTGPITIGGVTAPTGAAVVIPAGMAGDWEISGTVQGSTDDIPNPLEFSVFAGFLGDTISFTPYSGNAVNNTTGFSLSLTASITPYVFTFAAGDQFFMAYLMAAALGSPTITFGPNCYLYAKFLG